jgi:hemerythrin
MSLKQFEWTEALSVGDTMIDLQHRELIFALNDLSRAIENHEGSSEIHRLISFLHFYAKWHFSHEENCASRAHCTIADCNRQAHEKFLVIISSLHERYRTSGDSEAFAQQVHAQLGNWLINHILKIDTQIGPCLRMVSPGPDATPAQ